MFPKSLSGKIMVLCTSQFQLFFFFLVKRYMGVKRNSMAQGQYGIIYLSSVWVAPVFFQNNMKTGLYAFGINSYSLCKKILRLNFFTWALF